MSAPDWKWTPVLARLPADGRSVVIKFWDGSEAIRYGIGWYNAKEKSWVITAGPDLFDGFLVPTPRNARQRTRLHKTRLRASLEIR